MPLNEDMFQDLKTLNLARLSEAFCFAYLYSRDKGLNNANDNCGFGR